MLMQKEKLKLVGIWASFIFGLIIIGADLLISKVDSPTITYEKLENFSNYWTVSIRDSWKEVTQVPTKIEEAELGDTLILKKSLPDALENDTYLFFRGSHQQIQIFIGDTNVYQFGIDEERLFSKTPGCTWVVVPVPKDYAGEEIQIHLTGVYENYAGRINEIYLGDKSAIMGFIISARLGSILACFVLVVLGIIMMAVSISLLDGKITVSLFRLGILSALIGVWSGCVTNLLQLFWGNVFSLLNIEFFTFNLIVPVFIWFLSSFSYYKNRKILNILFWTSIALFFIIEILQFANIADYMETITGSHIIMGLTLGYLAFTGIRDSLKKNCERDIKVLTASVLLLLFFAGIDLMGFYVRAPRDEGFFTRIGMLFFILTWIIEIVINMSKLIVKITQTHLLEVLAYQDQMTNLFNRSAFEEKLVEYRSQDDKEAYIVEFDMNDLKTINDNFGHAKGDQAIILLAGIIKNEFEDCGIVYRIGGDEICAIVPVEGEISDQKIEEKISTILSSLKQVTEANELHFSVACGYSKMSRLQNKDIDAAYREADKHMYENKKKIKKIMKQQVL